MHTEEQAKKLWCPEVRKIMEANGGRNGIAATSINTEDALCIASECMHWRWAQRFEECDAATGYCGLSGRP